MSLRDKPWVMLGGRVGIDKAGFALLKYSERKHSGKLEGVLTTSK